LITRSTVGMSKPRLARSVAINIEACPDLNRCNEASLDDWDSSEYNVAGS
jgi:hypothetical protein